VSECVCASVCTHIDLQHNLRTSRLLIHHTHTCDTTSATGRRLISAIFANTAAVCPGCERASFRVAMDDALVVGESELIQMFARGVSKTVSPRVTPT
jgi:hypothetical protein